MEAITINRTNFKKYISIMSKYAALNEDLCRFIEVYDVRKIEPKDTEMYFKGFFMRNRNNSITIRRIANDVNDFRMRRLPGVSPQSAFARKVFEDLIWCAAFLDAGEIEELIDGSNFTIFEDGGEYDYFEEAEDVGNGPNIAHIKRDYCPNLNVFYFKTYRVDNKEPDSRYWDFIDLYELGDDKVLIAVQCHSIYEDVRSSYRGEVFNYADGDKIGEWLSEFLEDTNLIDEVVTEIKSW